MEEEKTRDASKIERGHSINLYMVPVVVVEARSTQGTGETDAAVSGTKDAGAEKVEQSGGVGQKLQE